MSSPKPKRESGSDGRLRAYERQYRLLRRELSRIGYLIKGSLQIRRTVCGYDSCRCRKGGRYRHGPYYWWTSKVAGKTVTVLLSEEEGKLYVSWVQNRQFVNAILEKMYEVSAHVARLKVGRVPPLARK